MTSTALESIDLDDATARLDSALAALIDFFVFVEPIRPMPSELDETHLVPEPVRPYDDRAADIIEHAARDIECLLRRIVLNRAGNLGMAE